jgi:hypothetical protein
MTSESPEIRAEVKGNLPGADSSAALHRRGRGIAMTLYVTEWDKRGACFDKLSMRFFSMP